MGTQLRFMTGLLLVSAIIGTGILVARAAPASIGSQRLSARSAPVTVPRSTPAIAQSPSAGGDGGTTPVTDSATLTSGTANAAGSLSFRLWSDPGCTVQFGETKVVGVAGANGVTYTSGSLIPISAATYRWTVDYSGDADNLAIVGDCGAAGSTVTIATAPLSYTAVGAPTSTTSNGSATVNYPAGTVVNDLLILVEINADGGNTSTPSGWTLLANQSTNTPSNFGIRVWTRLSAGETSVNLGFKSGAGGSTAWVTRYTRSSGYPPNPTTATAAVRSGVSAASSTLTPSPNLTTSAANARVISIVAIRSLNAVSLTSPQSFGLRSVRTATPIGGAGVTVAVSDTLQTSAGSTPVSPTWTQSGTAAQWAWATIAWS